MKAAILIRTASFQAHHLPVLSPRSPAASGGGGGPSGAAGGYFLRRSRSTKLLPRSALQIDVNKGSNGESDRNPIRRARSDTDLHLPPPPVHWSPPTMAEEEGEGAIALTVRDLRKAPPTPTPTPTPTPPSAAEDELQYSGGGTGRGRTRIGSSDDSSRSENKRMGEYYREMLRSDPANPLLLRNYGRFLHEVELDVEGAEECYGRAILASPGDGDVLSLYGRLVWEAHGDGERAGAYFERAVKAAPDDCYVLGSYANFLWDVDEEEEQEKGSMTPASPASTLVKAF